MEHFPLDEGTGYQFDDVGYFHVSAEGTYELDGLDRSADDSPSEKQGIALHADAVQDITRKDSRVNVGTLEPFVPVSLVIDNPTVDVFLP